MFMLQSISISQSDDSEGFEDTQYLDASEVIEKLRLKYIPPPSCLLKPSPVLIQ